MDLSSAVVLMLNALSAGVSGGTDSLLQSPAQYNKPLYDAAMLLQDTAVKPVTAIVLAIIFMLMLASNSTRIEADRELGVRIISGTLLKSCPGVPGGFERGGDLERDLGCVDDHLEGGERPECRGRRRRENHAGRCDEVRYLLGRDFHAAGSDRGVVSAVPGVAAGHGRGDRFGVRPVPADVSDECVRIIADRVPRPRTRTPSRSGSGT
ncbi:hypothetical protein [Leifsonia xyli]|uniref:hypothetical protein n=1 Tax=Leifsonia xyli TaxID=1575 RepID=UPI00114D2589|nr:hypothetical protein [Leifsonia xyli]